MKNGLPIESRLAAFLKRESTRPFKLGSFDCGLLLADWCMDCRGMDPAAPIRGRYGSLEEALSLTGTSSLPAMFNKLFRGAGFKLTRRPGYGDVAVIKIGDAPLRGAIVTDRGFVLCGEAGISRAPKTGARLVCAWSVNA